MKLESHRQGFLALRQDSSSKVLQFAAEPGLTRPSAQVLAGTPRPSLSGACNAELSCRARLPDCIPRGPSTNFV